MSPKTPLALALLLCALAPPAPAAKLKVPQQYPTINAAVAAAAAGDVVLVAKGVYAENVVVDGKADLRLKGSGMPLIKPVAAGDGLRINNSDRVTVAGFKIRGASARGIILTSSDDVTIRDCEVRDTGQEGIIAFIGSDHAFLVDNEVRESAGDGIAAYSYHAVVRGNRVLHGGSRGIVLAGWNCIAEDNVVKDMAGDGIHSGVIPTNLQTLVAGNRIDKVDHGIQILSGAAGMTVIGNRIRNTQAQGLLLEGGSHSILDNRVTKAHSTGIAANCSESVLASNRMTDCIGSGLIVAGDMNTVDHNRMIGSQGYGLGVPVGASDNLISANLAKKNGAYDLGNWAAPMANVFIDNHFKTIEP